MKIASRIGLMGLLLSAAWSAPAVYAAQDEAAPKTTVAQNAFAVTRDNFVSLSWQTWGGRAGPIASVEIKGNTISRITPHPRANGENSVSLPNVPETRGVSNQQLERLIGKMSATHLPDMAGSYRDKNLRDGSADTLTLTLSDENGEDREFVIFRYGNVAPVEVGNFIAYFQAFVDKKFAPRQTSVAKD